MALLAIACGADPAADDGSAPTADQNTTNGDSTSGASGTDAPTSTGPAAEAEAVQLLLPAPPSIRFFPVHLAAGLGYFEEEGLSVTSQGTDGSGFVVQQIASGNSVVGQSTVEPAILGFVENPTYQATYEFFTQSTFDLYTLADSDITEVADLEGQVLGVPDLVGGEALLARILLIEAGLDPQTDVQIESVGFPPAPQLEALTSGRTDAILVAWNTQSAASVAGVEFNCITCGQLDLAASTILMPNEVIENQPELVVGIGRAMAKATLFAETNPDAALQVLSEQVPEEFADPEFARQLLVDTLEFTAAREEGRYGLASLEAWNNKMELMLTEGAESGLTAPIDLEQLVNNDFVDQYNDFDADAIRAEAEEAPEYQP